MNRRDFLKAAAALAVAPAVPVPAQPLKLEYVWFQTTRVQVSTTHDYEREIDLLCDRYTANKLEQSMKAFVVARYGVK